MYGNGHDGENHADVRDERSIRRLAHPRRKLPRGGPDQPSERDGADETTADKDLDIHVVAVHARVGIREAGETAMTAGGNCRGRRQAAGAPQTSPRPPATAAIGPAAPSEAADGRLADGDMSCPPAGPDHRHPRDGSRRARLGAEPQTPLVDHVPHQPIARRAARAATRVARTVALAPGATGRSNAVRSPSNLTTRSSSGSSQ